MLKIAGVVVLYNPEEECIENIRTYSDKVQKLYVIDNSDKVNKFVICNLKKIERVKYISLGENKGLAYALNVGARKAIEEHFEWLLTMDQDSKFYNNIVEIYRSYIVEHDCSNVALLSPQYDTERSTPIKNNDIVELYWTMQSANLINLNRLEKLGFFEEKYFIDCIDYEYCLKARKNGYKILRCNEAILKHSPAMNKKIGSINYGYANPLRIYYQVRNALDMWKKYHNCKSLGIIAVKLGKAILLYDNKKEYLYAIRQAIYDCNNGIFGRKELTK